MFEKSDKIHDYVPHYKRDQTHIQKFQEAECVILRKKKSFKIYD